MPETTQQQQGTHTQTALTVECVPTSIGCCFKLMPLNACIYVDDYGARTRPRAEQEANARRLVACWNLLSDFPTPLIEFLASIQEPLLRLATLAEAANKWGEAKIQKLVDDGGDSAIEAIKANAVKEAARVSAAALAGVTAAS